MKINELQAGQGKIDLTAEVVEKAEPRSFEKSGNQGKVCNAKIKDDSGTITLTLWNEQVDQTKVGDLVRISNGWVSEWRGELQLSTGKFGKLEVVKLDELKETEEAEKDKENDITSEKSESGPIEEQDVAIEEEKVE